MTDREYMEQALAFAREAAQDGEVPVGCVIVQEGRIIGTGRSDFPNQVNNVVIFPGIFKGALEGRATAITEDMKLAAATAIADLVPPEKLCDDFILPEAFDPMVSELVSQAVKKYI